MNKFTIKHQEVSKEARTGRSDRSLAVKSMHLRAYYENENASSLR
jgi:hypothetical protein